MNGLLDNNDDSYIKVRGNRLRQQTAPDDANEESTNVSFQVTALTDANAQASVLLPQKIQRQKGRNSHRCVQIQWVAIPSFFFHFPILNQRVMELIKESHQVPLQHSNSDLSDQRHVNDTRNLQKLIFVDILKG